MLTLKTSDFSRSREICPNLPSGVHEIASNIAKKKEKQHYIFPQELALTFATILEEKKIADFELFPQLVDRMAQDNREEYADIFRKICKSVLGIDPPIIITHEEYSECIRVAVNWWTRVILFRNDTINMPTAFQEFFNRTYTIKEIGIFKSTLARQIYEELSKEGIVNLYSEWVAESSILEIAGNKIGIDPLLGYPNAGMVIWEDEVKVSINGGKTWETIFCSY